MAKSGPSPKPTELRLLEGNPGKRPINVNEPRPDRGKGTPRCPNSLEGPARAEWRRLAPILHKIGLLTLADLGQFMVYCAAWGRFVEASRMLAAHGLVDPAVRSDGNDRPSVWLTIQEKAAQTMHRVGAEFGLTPASRSRVSVEPRSGSDEFEDFIRRRR